MTENEKLRALLAEAQSGLMCDRYREAWERCDCAVCAVKTRIDAALAEPVGECARCETLRDLADKAAWAQGDAQRRMIEAQKQRDESRAEVERLSTALTQETRLSLHTQRQLDEARAEVDRLQDVGNTVMDNMIGLHREVVEKLAYHRGAEAMREAAASLFDGRVGLAQSPAYATVIRALPLPEDKR